MSWPHTIHNRQMSPPCVQGASIANHTNAPAPSLSTAPCCAQGASIANKLLKAVRAVVKDLLK